MNTAYRKVMIVDDNEIDHYIASRYIRTHGFAKEVINKISARSALEYLCSNAATPDELPQLIFLDIRMPEIDGFGFMEEYEKFPQVVKDTCTIMLLTSSADPIDHERARKNRYIKQFLNKPLDKEKLELLIKH